ncbi:YjcZ family sporulation protein [Virgibacillus oceani]
MFSYCDGGFVLIVVLFIY